MIHRLTWVGFLVALTACQPQSEQTTPPSQPTTMASGAGAKGISSDTFRAEVKTLSSDAFGGRLPATEGEQKTLDYLTEQFKALDWQPGNGESFLQQVPMQATTAAPGAELNIGDLHFANGQDVMLHSRRFQQEISLKASDMVFVGYGINAPERNWNDYQNIDVKGKTVVMLVNDPGFVHPDTDLFNGKAMTYYGRWTYKYEEASRQGAAAALIIHQTAPASYGWNVVVSSWSGPQYDLWRDDGNQNRVAVEGWLDLDAAKKVFAAAGLDLNAMIKQAADGPMSQPMGLKASTTLHNTLTKTKSYNFVATLPGRSHPDEHIIYSAHWDHLGTDNNLDGDQIYNGAMDNATGTAGLIELARAYTQLPTRPERSLTVLATTGEEQGLLGSQYYARHPLYPLAKTVAVFNMDSLNMMGQMKDLTIVGYGKSDLDDVLAKAAATQERTVHAEQHPEGGGYFRSDHFSFALQGVPSAYAGGGDQPRDPRGADYRKQMTEHRRACYHQTCDEYSDTWDVSGALDDLNVFFTAGLSLANSDHWPEWHKDAEFKRQ